MFKPNNAKDRFLLFDVKLKKIHTLQNLNEIAVYNFVFNNLICSVKMLVKELVII